MEWIHLRRWAPSLLVGTLFIASCSETEKQPDDRLTPRPMAWQRLNRPAQDQQATAALPAREAAAPSRVIPSGNQYAGTVPSVPGMGLPQHQEFNPVVKPAGYSEAAVVAIPADSAEAVAPVKQAVVEPIAVSPKAGISGAQIHQATYYQDVTNGETGKPEPRTAFPRAEPARGRVVTDITSKACFAHAEDYAWLAGSVDYDHKNRSWKLRYASVDEEDRFGGSVTLVDNGTLGTLKEGQSVRVKGRIIEPENRATRAQFEVKSFELLEK